MINEICKLLLETVIEHPSKQNPKLVLADALDESGLCGESMRWAARNRKRPISFSGNSDDYTKEDQYLRRYYQWSRTNGTTFSILPSTVYDHLDRSTLTTEFDPWIHISSRGVVYRSARDAWTHYILAFKVAFDKGLIGYTNRERTSKRRK